MSFDGRVWMQSIENHFMAVDAASLEPIRFVCDLEEGRAIAVFSTREALMEYMGDRPRESFIITQIINGKGIIDQAQKENLRVLVDPHVEVLPNGQRVERWGEITGDTGN